MLRFRPKAFIHNQYRYLGNFSDHSQYFSALRFNFKRSLICNVPRRNITKVQLMGINYNVKARKFRLYGKHGQDLGWKSHYDAVQISLRYGLPLIQISKDKVRLATQVEVPRMLNLHATQGMNKRNHESKQMQTQRMKQKKSKQKVFKFSESMMKNEIEVTVRKALKHLMKGKQIVLVVCPKEKRVSPKFELCLKKLTEEIMDVHWPEFEVLKAKISLKPHITKQGAECIIDPPAEVLKEISEREAQKEKKKLIE